MADPWAENSGEVRSVWSITSWGGRRSVLHPSSVTGVMGMRRQERRSAPPAAASEERTVAPQSSRGGKSARRAASLRPLRFLRHPPNFSRFNSPTAAPACVYSLLQPEKNTLIQHRLILVSSHPSQVAIINRSASKKVLPAAQLLLLFSFVSLGDFTEDDNGGSFAVRPDCFTGFPCVGGADRPNSEYLRHLIAPWTRTEREYWKEGGRREYREVTP